GGEAAAEAIGAEGLRHAVGPDLYAAIVDHAQRQAVSVAALGSLAELLGRAVGPVDLHVDADQFALRVGPRAGFVRVRGLARLPAVADHLKLLRLPTDSFHHGAR